mgnify:CR=1 FL=1
MERNRADLLAAIVVGAVSVLGGLWAWDRYQARQAVDGRMDGMMGSMMDGMGATGPDPVVVAVGTLVVAGTLAGVYLLFREEVTHAGTQGPEEIRASEAPPVPESEAEPAESSADADSVTGLDSQRALLDLLPEDERRILDPVLESPGLTQIELRDRADFSKSKVSQTVSDLEKRGLLYREKQGRTYRVYPAERLPGRTE